MQEIWKRWQPIDETHDKYIIESIEYTIQGSFKMMLSKSYWKPLSESERQDKTKQISILFKNGVIAHRETNETFRISTYGILDDNYGTDFYTKWTFFKITNSSYLKWISEKCGFTDSYPLTHYSFLTLDEILDVISADEPIIEIIDTSNESPKTNVDAD